MSKQTLTIATRKSPLAMWQAEYVQAGLSHAFPELNVELLPMSTKGDRILDTPLAKVDKAFVYQGTGSCHDGRTCRHCRTFA